MRLAILALCALAGASFASETQKTAPAPREVEKKSVAVDKIAVIGASISAGFRLDGNTDPFADSKLKLADIVSASLNVPHQPVVNQATQSFFMDPTGTAAATMSELATEKPTLVVAIDYLFWFGYGVKKEEQRVPALEAALASLAKLECPILLGDLPDMTLASRTNDPVFGRPMLQKTMLPSADTLKQLNEKIAAFAKEHKNVVIVPLADLTTKLQSDAEVSVHGNKWPKGSIDKLMQGDRLHTTLEGTCAVWVVAVDAWLAKSKDLPAATFELDVAKLLAKVRVDGEKPVPSGAPVGKAPAGPVEKPKQK